MAVIICIAGAAVGLIIAAVGNWLVLPIVLQSLDRQLGDRTIRMPLPALLGGDPRPLLIAIYRYVMPPLVLAAAGGVAAYYVFITDVP